MKVRVPMVWVQQMVSGNTLRERKSCKLQEPSPLPLPRPLPSSCGAWENKRRTCRGGRRPFVSSDIVSSDIVSSDIVSSDIVSSDIVSSGIYVFYEVKSNVRRNNKRWVMIDDCKMGSYLNGQDRTGQERQPTTNTYPCFQKLAFVAESSLFAVSPCRDKRKKGHHITSHHIDDERRKKKEERRKKKEERRKKKEERRKKKEERRKKGTGQDK